MSHGLSTNGKILERPKDTYRADPLAVGYRSLNEARVKRLSPTPSLLTNDEQYG